MAVTGTGRCGTGTIATLLSRHGLKTGHEHWWNAGIGPRKSGLDVDVSWLALPAIESGSWAGPVVALIRDPVAVVRSLVRTRFFHPANRDAPFVRFALTHCPDARRLDPVEAAVEWWLDWNNRCATVADAVIAIETLTGPPGLSQDRPGTKEAAVADLARVAGTAIDADVIADIPADTNHVPRGMDPARTDTDAAAAVSADRVWALIGGRDAYGYARAGARS